jgi:mRNA-degrading endonuclease RelE of RelBE toxin-antitoxin system
LKSKTARSFWRAYDKLSPKWRKRAQAAYRTFEEDPSHPGLQFKKVGDNPTLYSARVSRDYRALGVLEGDTIVWFWIGNHEEYDRLLASWGG